MKTFIQSFMFIWCSSDLHRDNLRINNQQDAPSIQHSILTRNSICFGHLLCPSSGVTSCTRGNCYVSCRSCGRCLGESGFNLTLLGSGHITCRVSWQNKMLDTWCILLVIYTRITNLVAAHYTLFPISVSLPTPLETNCLFTTLPSNTPQSTFFR